MKLLTICIPTYNRSEYVITQLIFLLNEISPYKHLIDIKVADNFSDAQHREKLIKYHKMNNFFQLELNDKNYGLIGNIYKLLNETESDYVWFVGDDDVIKAGVALRLINVLSLEKPDYMFLNFNAFYDSPENIIASNELMGFKGLINDKNFAINFFNKNGTACMFITASIYKTQTIKEISTLNRETSITDPLLFFFKATQKTIYIVDEVYVFDRLSQISWKEEQRDVFAWKIPNTILELNELSIFETNTVTSLIYNYFKSQKNYIIMLSTAPKAIKRKLIALLSFKQFNLILGSIIYLSSVILKKIYRSRSKNV